MMTSFSTTFFLIFVVIQANVHCYPQAWGYSQFCQAKSFQMPVEAEGCESLTIQNNFCYGQCLSQFFPAGWKQDVMQGYVACSACVPVSTVTKKVVLKCPGHPKKYDIRKIRIIMKCKCKAAFCKVISYYQRGL